MQSETLTKGNRKRLLGTHFVVENAEISAGHQVVPSVEQQAGCNVENHVVFHVNKKFGPIAPRSLHQIWGDMLSPM